MAGVLALVVCAITTVAPPRDPHALLAHGIASADGIVKATAETAATHGVPPHTASGFSSGGIMVLQHLVALSSVVTNISANAGFLALPANVIEALSQAGALDPTSNLARAHVHLWRGENDTVVTKEAAVDTNLATLTELGVPSERIVVQTEPHAPHSVVVTGDPQAQPCDHQGPQWINDCGVQRHSRHQPVRLSPSLPATAPPDCHRRPRCSCAPLPIPRHSPDTRLGL